MKLTGRLAGVGRVPSILVLGSLAFAACGGSEDVAVDARRAQLAEGCLLNTDCGAPLVCAFRKCHTQCTSTRDCEAGLLCVASDKPFHVCQLPSETKCSYNSQCSGSQVCGVDGKCREQCATEKDCLPGQRCAQATCAEPVELTAGKLPVASGSSGAGGAPAGGACVYARDCPEPLVCRSGQCMAECLDDPDCVSPKVCVASRCALPPPGDGSTPPKGYGEGCNLNSDCPLPLLCGKAGLCVYECNSGVDCASGCCAAHACVSCGAGGSSGSGGAAGAGGGGAAGEAGAGGASGASGGTGGTSGTSGSGGATGGPCDLDGDGFKAAGGSCGGNDCDDGNDKVYPGAKELCDGLDNNCDGYIDENAWVTQGAKEIAVPGAFPGSDPSMPAPPSLVVLPGTPPRVFLSATDYTGGSSSRVILQELTTSLDPKGSATQIESAGLSYKTSLATDGTTLAVGVTYWEGSTHTLRAKTFSPDAPPSTLPIVATIPDASSSRPVMVWTGSKYVLFWADAHDAGPRIYRAIASPLQPFFSPIALYADPTKLTGVDQWYPTLAVGVGPSSIAVLSRTNSAMALATLDTGATTLGVPLVDSVGASPPELLPSVVVRVGGDWLALGSYFGGSAWVPVLVRVDAASGVASVSRSLPAVSTGNAAFGDALSLGTGGALFAWNAGSSVKFTFVPPDLGTKGVQDPGSYPPLPIGEIQGGNVATPPVLARIDPTHLAVVWQDGKIKGAILECAP